MEQTIIEQAKQLLQSTGAILEKHEEIARLKGENYNVFRVLGIEHREDELHSRFIAELLNPTGSHDQGTVFLKMFLEQVVKPLTSDSLPEESKAKVYREYYIGGVKIAGDESTGGRIDLFITDETRHISIENKIYAGEGEHQITRYCNYKPDSNLVLFLTLRDDDEASTEKPYHPISYREHIIPWLESCQKHCADLPILRETIKQYIITIKGLTGGLTMQKMDEDLKKLMGKNIDAAHAIYSNYESFVEKKVEKNLQELFKELKEEIEGQEPVSQRLDDWELCIYGEKGYGGLKIKNKKWIDADLKKTKSEDHHLQIEILGHYTNNRLHYGIVANENHFDTNKIIEKLDGIEKLDEKIKQHRKDENFSAFWGFYWDLYKNKDSRYKYSRDYLKKLLNKEEREELANKLIELIDFCDSKLLPSEDSR